MVGEIERKMPGEEVAFGNKRGCASRWRGNGEKTTDTDLCHENFVVRIKSFAVVQKML